MTRSLVTLSEYLMLLVCLELPLEDIISLRQVCRVLSEPTRAKTLWIHKLEHAVHHEGQILPPYMKTYHLLDATALEALVRRMSTLSLKWAARDLSPVKIWRLYLPQSITWLRLVAGTWLFVASSDDHNSKISCWDLSLVFQGSLEPLAEAYLPGQVKTGKVEVQDSGVVLALGLGAESLAVHIITLRRRSGVHSFSELCRIEGSSHVLMLCSNIVGCGLRHGAVVPHIMNWRDLRIHDIPPPPGGLDIPGRRSVPHLITIWSGILVIVRSKALEFYTLSSTAGTDPLVFVKLIRTSTIWEAAVCDSASGAPNDIPPLRLFVISAQGIEMCVIDRDMLLPMLDEDRPCPRICLAKTPYRANKQPWYHLCVGQSGRRCLWISEADYSMSLGPQFMYMNVLPISPDTEMFCSKTNDDPAQPAIWAIPAVDCDDTLGFTVVGNCFGELAIYDHGGRHPERCAGLAVDFTDQQSPISPLLPTMPIPLGLYVAPRAPKTSHTEVFDQSVISRWSQDDIDLDEFWRTDWPPGYHTDEFTGYMEWDMWQGAPNDLAWALEHAYGFPGPVHPQAYADDDEWAGQHLLFRSGQRYFAFTAQSEPNLRSWPLTPPRRFFAIGDAQPESMVRPTAKTEGAMYRGMLSLEISSGRNRWIEQAERGGRPHKNLLSRQIA
ncbi:hypothetical protein DFH09DRAFT_190435 [Mycena vulgaris]|nr:hypothetical protein DFH09DRAFT_190435 [Mycena vulgaris]